MTGQMKQTREQMLATRKAYREVNKEKISLASKKYYEEHKEELIEKSKKYQQANPEKIKQYKMKPESIAKDKKYKSTAEYKARQKENNKIYYSNPENKARQQKHLSEKIPCNVCGCMSSRHNMSRHQKTKTCQKFLKNELNDLMNNIIIQIEQINDI